MISLCSATIFTLLQCLQDPAGIDTLLLFHLSQSLDGRPPQGALAAHTPPIDDIAEREREREKKYVIRDLNSGISRTGFHKTMSKDCFTCKYRHSLDVESCLVLGCKVRGAAGLQGALQWPLLLIQSLLLQQSALQSQQITDLGLYPLYVCVCVLLALTHLNICPSCVCM